MKRKLLATVFCLLCCSDQCMPLNISEYENKITEHTLDNGMQFIILQDNTSPTVSFHVHVDVGSVNEGHGYTGISHFVEHLAFNGTRHIGTRDWKRERPLMEKLDSTYDKIRILSEHSDDNGLREKLEELLEEFRYIRSQKQVYSLHNEFGTLFDRYGAVGPNAYCSYDMTVYWVELPSNCIELWAILESDRLFNPVFRGFYEELEVIKEERRMRVDNSPWGTLREEFFNIAYRYHPYRNPIIGYMHDIEGMTRSKIKDFYIQYYIPEMMVVSIVGDVVPEKLIPILEKYFGRIPARDMQHPAVPSEPLSGSEKRVVVTMDAQPMLLIGFHTPETTHIDTTAIEATAEILGGGRASRLHQRLIKEEQAAISAGAWNWEAKYAGMFHIWAVPAEGYTNIQLEELIYEEIEKLKNENISDKEMSSAIRRIEMRFLKGLQSKRGIARELAWFHTLAGNWRMMFRRYEETSKISKRDIRSTAMTYFVPERRVVGFLEPIRKHNE